MNELLITLCIDKPRKCVCDIEKITRTFHDRNLHESELLFIKAVPAACEAMTQPLSLAAFSPNLFNRALNYF